MAAQSSGPPPGRRSVKTSHGPECVTRGQGLPLAREKPPPRWQRASSAGRTGRPRPPVAGAPPAGHDTAPAPQLLSERRQGHEAGKRPGQSHGGERGAEPRPAHCQAPSSPYPPFRGEAATADRKQAEARGDALTWSGPRRAGGSRERSDSPGRAPLPAPLLRLSRAHVLQTLMALGGGAGRLLPGTERGTAASRSAEAAACARRSARRRLGVAKALLPLGRGAHNGALFSVRGLPRRCS